MIPSLRALLIRGLIGAVAVVAIAPRASAQDERGEADGAEPAGERGEVRVEGGSAPAGFEIVVAPIAGVPVTLGASGGSLELPRGETRLGWRRGDQVEWQSTISLLDDLRIDVVIADHSGFRTLAYALIVAGGVLLAATAVVGIATEPEPPDVGWFGDQHGLVFAGIAGGIVLAFGIPGVGLALAFERDAPAIRTVPVDGVDEEPEME